MRSHGKLGNSGEPTVSLRSTTGQQASRLRNRPGMGRSLQTEPVNRRRDTNDSVRSKVSRGERQSEAQETSGGQS